MLLLGVGCAACWLLLVLRVWVGWYGALVGVWALHVATFVVAVYLLFGVVRFAMWLVVAVIACYG